MLNIGEFLSPGIFSDVKLTVKEEDTVGNFSPRLEQLLSTAACVKAFIKAATEATDHHLPDGYLTVGRSISIDHEAPSYLGTTVTFRAKLARIEGNKLFYELSAWDHQGIIATGTHVRAVVKWEILMNKARERAFSEERGV